MLNILDVFSGIGGFSLAADFLEWKTTDFVEIDPYCQKVLKKNFPDARIHADVTTYRGTRGSHDIITGGFPCQDLSVANQKGQGLKGDRSSLFYEVGRIIHEIRPQGFCLENVPGIYPWMGEVLSYFAESGLYDVQWFSLRVDQLRGTHRRRRVFILGKLTDSESITGRASWNQKPQEKTNQAFVDGFIRDDRTEWRYQSRFCGGNDGIPPRLDGYLIKKEWLESHLQNSLKPKSDWRSHDKYRLKALGNAVTPQQAYIALNTLKEWIGFCS